MNYIKHLTGFFERVAIDNTLNPTHVSLYMALFQFWNFNRFRNPISISRDEIMRISKISSKATYHKCLRNLHNLGYLDYQPSYNPFRGSQVIMFNFADMLKPNSSTAKPKNEPPFKPVNEQAVNKSCTGYQTSSEQALVPYINSINNTNKKENFENLDEQAKKISNSKDSNAKAKIISMPIVKEAEQRKKEEKSSAKKEEKKASPEFQQLPLSLATEIVLKRKAIPPHTSDVETYFDEQEYPALEAQKFYNYFASNGWLVGGKTKMKDWKAAARNWMLNNQKFKSHGEYENRAKHLNTTTGKNYSEPL